MTPQKIKIAKTSPAAVTPARQHDTDGGYDLSALTSVHLGSGQQKQVGTGIAIAIPAGYVGYITPRSGLSHHNSITVHNAPGTIDAGYRGELKVELVNTGRDPYHIKAGERIAQLTIQPVITPELEVVTENLLPTSDRGENGIGSTGTKPGVRPPLWHLQIDDTEAKPAGGKLRPFRIHKRSRAVPAPVYEYLLNHVTEIDIFDGDGIRHNSIDARGVHLTLKGNYLRVDHMGTTQRHYEGRRNHDA